MEQKQDLMVQKQDHILQYLRPKSPIVDEIASITGYDVSKAAATASSDEKSPTVEGGYKLKSGSSKKLKKSIRSSSDTDEGEEDTDKEGDDNNNDYKLLRKYSWI